MQNAQSRLGEAGQRILEMCTGYVQLDKKRRWGGGQQYTPPFTLNSGERGEGLMNMEGFEFTFQWSFYHNRRAYPVRWFAASGLLMLGFIHKTVCYNNTKNHGG